MDPLRSILREDWPRLAWFARAGRSGSVVVEAGAGVHIDAEWFGDVVWDGPFADADFDRTELVFGSGARIREGHIVFVSAGQTGDRLHSVETPDGLVVSNSLPCLLAGLGASLTLDHDYPPALRTVRAGIRSYQEYIPSSVGPIRLTYFQNLVWDGSAVTKQDKPAPLRDFGTFDRYRDSFASATRRLVQNAAHPARRAPLRAVATCSAGYDSSTVTAMVSDAADCSVVGLLETRDGRDDSGAVVAGALGLEFHGIPSREWSRLGGVEARFLSAGLAGGSSVPLRAAEPLLADCVLFTGYHGDKMWDLKTEGLEDDHARADLGGCDLMEFRLSAGFVHVMLPMFGSHQIVDVHEISRSAEMEPWRVGGSYDRPICRRIVEGAGVPRDAFARSKGAMQQWVVFTPETRAEFERWRVARAIELPEATDDTPSMASLEFVWAVESVVDQYYG